MRSKPAKFILLITTMLGLSVSAIAACACTHHQPTKSESFSCHGKTHEEPRSQPEAVPTGDSVSADCECALPALTPAIIVKNESKRLKAIDADSVGNPSVLPVELGALTVRKDLAVSISDPKFHKRKFSRSGPSRAPPRL